MQENVVYKEKKNKKKGKKYHKSQFFNASGKRFFFLMLQMFYSAEVIPSSTVWYMIKHHHLCLCLQENLPFLFSFFRNRAFTYYLCSTDYWSTGWRNAISLLLEMNQFEMPEVFGKLLLEMPVVLKMSSVSTYSIYLRKQRDDIVFDWRKKGVCTTTIK